MQYHSLASPGELYSLKEVLFKGLAPDGSLFMPEEIPALDPDLIRNIQDYSLPQLAFEVLKPFVTPDVPEAVLQQIVNDTFSFEIPDRKSTRLNSSHVRISYAVFCLKKKK